MVRVFELSRCLRRQSVFLPSSRRDSGVNRSNFSTSTVKAAYEDTIPNLKIGAHTRVVYQGFTGERVSYHTWQSTSNGYTALTYFPGRQVSLEIVQSA